MSARLSLVRVLILLALLPAPLSAQDAPAPARPGCALHPSPDCGTFGITEIGFAFGPDTRPHEWWDPGDGTIGELTLSGGAMKNATSHDALGGFWFVTIDGGGAFATGPAARYRRWFTPRRSLDAGAGVVIAGSDDLHQGSVMGHVRYNPAPWLGLVARPEQIRVNHFRCDTHTCYVADESELRVMVGADLTGKPGAVGLGAYGVAAGVMLVILLIAFRGD